VAAPCGSWSWKYWKKGANGCADGWSKSSKTKPTAKAEFSPLTGRKARHRRQRSLTLRTIVGLVKLQVWHGRDPQDEHWGCPLRERWGLTAHQQMSPALAEKLAFTATMSLSYEAAAQVAGQWGCPMDDSVKRIALYMLATDFGVCHRLPIVRFSTPFSTISADWHHMRQRLIRPFNYGSYLRFTDGFEADWRLGIASQRSTWQRNGEWGPEFSNPCRQDL